MLIAAKERKRPAADEATTPSIAPLEPDKLELEVELEVELELDDVDDELDATEELEAVAPQPLDEQVGS